MTGMLSISLPASAYECLDDQFKPKHDKDSIPRSLAQVFETKRMRQSDYLGTAFVIDAKYHLLLTAAHVVRDANSSDESPIGEKVVLRFPGINNGKDQVSATVVEIFERPENSRYGDHVDDIAILKLNEVSSKFPLQQLRLHMSQWSGRRLDDVVVHSYYGASNDVVPAPGTITRESNPDNVRENLKCILNVSITIDGGDSGAPVLNKDGFVLGVVLQDFPRGAIKHGKVMAAYCLTDHLPKALQKVVSKPSKSIAMAIYDKPNKDVAEILMPSKDGNQESSNPLIHYALTELGRLLEQSKNVKTEFIDKLQCPIMRATIERRITLPRTLSFSVVQQMVQLSKPLKEVADKRLKMAQVLAREKRYAAAAIAADISRIYYLAESTRQLKKGFPLFSKLPKSSLSSSHVFSNPTNSVRIGQTLKGYIDSVQLSRNMQNRLGYTQSKTQDILFGQDAGVLAVLLSQGKSRELQAQSWAVLGKEAFDAKDYFRAFEAFRAAIATGAPQNWIKKSYLLSWNLISSKEKLSINFVEPSQIPMQVPSSIIADYYNNNSWINGASQSLDRIHNNIKRFFPS